MLGRVKHAAPSASRLRRWTRQDKAGADRRPARGWAVQLPYWFTLAGVCAGLAIMLGGAARLRGGTLVLAGVLIAASLARLTLPVGQVGMLRARRRAADVAVLAVLGVGLLAVGVVLPAA